KQEVEKIFPEIIAGACETAKQHNLQVVVACAPLIKDDFFRQYTGKFSFTVVHEHVFEFMRYSRIGIIKSGTSTLQAGLSGLPMVIVYKTSPLTYAIGKNLVKIKHIGLANIVAGKTIVPEIIQSELTTANIVKELTGILTTPGRYEKIKSDLAELSEKLGHKRASENCAAIINGVLNAG
ncbi:MAG: lipid-A-disaccharide synthase, partial [Ignavibacteriales bacterium]|nr:lipid-A-disaccharide synthase [Ignavibacteriales bacterium]